MPRISVIIPTYNCANYLGVAIRSVLAQDCDDVEILVVDDGSTDHTPDIVSGFGDQIRYLRQENSGTAAARNRGIEASSGSYIAFLDADDIWLPGKLRAQVEVLEKGDVDIVHASWYFFLPDGQLIPYNKRHLPPGEQAERVILANDINTCTVMVDRQVLDRVGLFSEQWRCAEDLDLWLRLVASGARFFTIEEPLVVYRIHETSKTSTMAARSDLLDIHTGFFAGLGLDDPLRRLEDQSIGSVCIHLAGACLRIEEYGDYRDYLAVALLRLRSHAELPQMLAAMLLPCGIAGTDSRYVEGLTAGRLSESIDEVARVAQQTAGLDPATLRPAVVQHCARRLYNLRCYGAAARLCAIELLRGRQRSAELISVLGRASVRAVLPPRGLRSTRRPDSAEEVIRSYIHSLAG